MIESFLLIWSVVILFLTELNHFFNDFLIIFLRGRTSIVNNKSIKTILQKLLHFSSKYAIIIKITYMFCGIIQKNSIYSLEYMEVYFFGLNIFTRREGI